MRLGPRNGSRYTAKSSPRWKIDLDIGDQIDYIEIKCKQAVSMNKTMISAQIPEKLGSEIEALAKSTKRSKAFLITEALEDYVHRKAWLVQQIDDAVREADESGVYISGEAMKQWLLSWGTDRELQPPEPDIFKKRL